MKKFTEILTISILTAMLSVGSVFAFDFGTEITIFDTNVWTETDLVTGINASGEDDEAEPGMTQSQVWDLEGFFLDDNNILSMVGGYDFVNGENTLDSGDIFLDVHGDAEFGDIDDNDTAGNKTVTDTFGYDYVLDMNFQDFTYDVYRLDAGSSTITSRHHKNQGSNPWLYADGGTLLKEGISFEYHTGLTDDEAGFSGWGTDSHNLVTGLDLNFLADEEGMPVGFFSHYTMECGNDNLMGYGELNASPEPSTMFLLGSGLAGLAIMGRKKFNKKR